MRKFTINYFIPALMAVIVAVAAVIAFGAFLGLFLYALTKPVQADVGDIFVSPYSQTWHSKPCGYRKNGTVCEKYVDSHPSLGVEYLDSENKSVSVGLYRDSYGTTSAYLARHWRYAYGLGATMGVLAGPSYPHKFVTFLGPEITAQVLGVKASLAYLPNFGVPNQPSITVLQVAAKVW